MRILLATGIYPPEIGGPATYAQQFVAELSRRGHTVEVVTYGEAGVSRSIPKGIRHIVFFARCLKAARKADVVFSQDMVGAGIPALWAARLARIPYVLRVPGDYAWEIAVQRFGVVDGIDAFQIKRYGWQAELLRWLEQTTACAANAVICPSEYFRKLVAGWGVRGERLHAIYNGMEFASESLPHISYADRERVIFSAGRLVPWKGFDGLIRLMQELPDWKLHIAGDGPDRERLQSLCAELGVTERVLFLGRVSRTDLFQRLARARVFVLNTAFESFSFQTIEAMFAGVPVVAANIGSLPEIIQSGTNGVLVMVDDRAAIRSAIERLESDASWRDALIERAERDSRQYSVGRTMDAVEALCQSLRSSRV
jgi:glycosyltransferase involved in cell wall biosynthesis